MELVYNKTRLNAKLVTKHLHKKQINLKITRNISRIFDTSALCKCNEFKMRTQSLKRQVKINIDLCQCNVNFAAYY